MAKQHARWARFRRTALVAAVAVAVACPINAQAPTAEQQWRSLIEQAIEAFNARDFPKGIPLAEEALRLARLIFGNRAQILPSLGNLALLYRAQGRYGEAEPLYRELLEASRELLGPSHPITLIGLNNLANLYSAWGRYSEAEPLFQEALQAKREVPGSRHPETLVSLNDLAVLYEAEGLNLDGTELVVPSACDTAQGSLDYSEGVFGLARALRTAGARTVLVTLWKLQGRRGARLHRGLLQELAHTRAQRPAKALRDTQLRQPPRSACVGSLCSDRVRGTRHT
jgi:tetratricopeptide (TPR) repeat protein